MLNINSEFLIDIVKKCVKISLPNNQNAIFFFIGGKLLFVLNKTTKVLFFKAPYIIWLFEEYYNLSDITMDQVSCVLNESKLVKYYPFVLDLQVLKKDEIEIIKNIIK